MPLCSKFESLHSCRSAWEFTKFDMAPPRGIVSQFIPPSSGLIASIGIGIPKGQFRGNGGERGSSGGECGFPHNSNKQRQMTHTNPERKDTGLPGPVKPIIIEGRMNLESWEVKLLVAALAVYLLSLLGEEPSVLWVLPLGTAVWAVGMIFRDALWQWSRPVLTLDSSTLRLRIDSKRQYLEVNLEEVADCWVEPGNDLRVALHSGVEHAIDLTHFSDAEEESVLAALEDIVARNQESAQVG